MDDQVLGERIRQARRMRHMTQEELAEAVGKDQKAVSLHENGRRSVSALDLLRFAEVLQMPITYFYEGEAESADELDSDMLYAFHRLTSQELREAILQVIRVLGNTSQA